MDIQYNGLDDTWIHEFENGDNVYKDFYKDDLCYINVRVIYINRENEIDKLKEESFLMTTLNYIHREEILAILKKHSIDNSKRYTLLSILKYNIILDPEDVKMYLSDNTRHEYLTIIKNIDTIVFDKSIHMFQDLNELMLIFYEKSSELQTTNSNNTTKKIYLRSLHKKTIKKRYKE